MVKNILKFEGLAILIVAVYLYHLSGASWLLFFVLLFAPDISMIGYLKDKKFGAMIYNIGHNYVIAIILVAIGLFTIHVWLVNIGIILVAHVSLDRMLGYGLKYKENFKETHMQKV